MRQDGKIEKENRVKISYWWALERTRDRREPKAAQDELDQYAAVLSSCRLWSKTGGAGRRGGAWKGAAQGRPYMELHI